MRGRSCSKHTSSTDPERKRRVANSVVDAFVAAKWLLVLGLWVFDVSHPVLVVLVAYLVVWNSLTYFHYHLWIIEDPKRSASSHRERRRFVSLVLAMAYSMVTFAYLYHRVHPGGFEWPDSTPRWIASITYSIGNALTSQSGGLRPVDGASYLLGASQLVFTFGFVAMLLSSSLPRVRTV